MPRGLGECSICGESVAFRDLADHEETCAGAPMTQQQLFDGLSDLDSGDGDESMLSIRSGRGGGRKGRDDRDDQENEEVEDHEEDVEIGEDYEDTDTEVDDDFSPEKPAKAGAKGKKHEKPVTKGKKRATKEKSEKPVKKSKNARKAESPLDSDRPQKKVRQPTPQSVHQPSKDSWNPKKDHENLEQHYKLEQRERKRAKKAKRLEKERAEAEAERKHRNAKRKAEREARRAAESAASFVPVPAIVLVELTVITCDQCGVDLLDQKRYACSDCECYDLCEGCFDNRASIHPGHSFYDKTVRSPDELEKVLGEQISLIPESVLPTVAPAPLVPESVLGDPSVRGRPKPSRLASASEAKPSSGKGRGRPKTADAHVQLVSIVNQASSEPGKIAGESLIVPQMVHAAMQASFAPRDNQRAFWNPGSYQFQRMQYLAQNNSSIERFRKLCAAGTARFTVVESRSSSLGQSYLVQCGSSKKKDLLWVPVSELDDNLLAQAQAVDRRSAIALVQAQALAAANFVDVKPEVARSGQLPVHQVPLQQVHVALTQVPVQQVVVPQVSVQPIRVQQVPVQQVPIQEALSGPIPSFNRPSILRGAPPSGATVVKLISSSRARTHL